MVKVHVRDADGSFAGGFFKSAGYESGDWPTWIGSRRPGFLDVMYYMQGKSWLLIEWDERDLRLVNDEYGEPVAEYSTARWQPPERIVAWFNRNGLALPSTTPKLLNDSTGPRWKEASASSIRLLEFLNAPEQRSESEETSVPEGIRDQVAIALCCELGLIQRFEVDRSKEPYCFRGYSSSTCLAIGVEGRRLMAAKWLSDACEPPEPDLAGVVMIQPAPSKKAGRRRVSDPREDKRIYELKKANPTLTYEELGWRIGKTETETRHAYDRHRKSAQRKG